MSVQVSTVHPRRTGFFMIDNEAVDSCDLSPRALSLYVILARHINHETGLAFPSLARLCDLARMARATVVKYLRELERKGWIQIIRSRKPGSKERAVNRYRVLNPARVEAPDQGRSSPEPPPPQPVRTGPGGSSNREQGVVQIVNEGSSSPEQSVVHDLNGKETDPQKNQSDKTNVNQRVPAPRANGSAEAAGDVTREDPPQTIPSHSRKNLAWEEFCHTLADVCQLDYDANQGKIRKAAARLWKNGKGYNPIDLRRFKIWWYQRDWRGQKGDLPTLQNVSELIRAAVETSSPEPDSYEARLERYVTSQGEYADIIRY